MPTTTRLLECGSCGEYHPEASFLPGGSANYMNDCRYDPNRFACADDFTERTGQPAIEVSLDEQDEYTKTYEVFVRDWWRIERGQRIPNPGADETQLATGLDYDAALAMCEEYNSTHDPGEVSRKAEFRSE